MPQGRVKISEDLGVEQLGDSNNLHDNKGRPDRSLTGRVRK